MLHLVLEPMVRFVFVFWPIMLVIRYRFFFSAYNSSITSCELGYRTRYVESGSESISILSDFTLLGKLGLLPKRPVSLLPTQSSTSGTHSPPADGAPGHPTRISTEQTQAEAPGAVRHNSDADDLYVDDPFEDGHEAEAEITIENISK